MSKTRVALFFGPLVDDTRPEDCSEFIVSVGPGILDLRDERRDIAEDSLIDAMTQTTVKFSQPPKMFKQKVKTLTGGCQAGGVNSRNNGQINIKIQALHNISRFVRPFWVNHWIPITNRHQDRHRGVRWFLEFGVVAALLNGLSQRQIAGQTENTADSQTRRDTSQERHDTALGEAT